MTLRGTLRWLDPAVRERALVRIEEIATGVCAGLQPTLYLGVSATVPVLRCEDWATALLAHAASSAGAYVI